VVMACGHMGQWEGAARKAGAPKLSTEKEMHGLEVPKLTRRSREFTWGIHGCQGSIQIPMQLVNGNRGGS
jgi:hypothetical protein